MDPFVSLKTVQGKGVLVRADAVVSIQQTTDPARNNVEATLVQTASQGFYVAHPYGNVLAWVKAKL